MVCVVCILYDISGTRPTETSFYQLFACASAHTCSQFGSLSLSRHVYVCIYTYHTAQLIWYQSFGMCSSMYMDTPCIQRSVQQPVSSSIHIIIIKCVLYYVQNRYTRARTHKWKRHAYHKRAILFLKSKVAAASASIYHKVYPPARIYPNTLIYECVYVACTLHFSFFRWNLWYGEIIHTFHSHMDVRALSQASRRILEMCLRITQQCIRTQHTHTQTHSANSFTQRESI